MNKEIVVELYGSIWKLNKKKMLQTINNINIMKFSSDKIKSFLALLILFSSSSLFVILFISVFLDLFDKTDNRTCTYILKWINKLS